MGGEGPLYNGQKSENPLFRARSRLIECENRIPSFRQWGTTRSTRFTTGNRRREREREGRERRRWRDVARRSNFHQGKCRFHRRRTSDIEPSRYLESISWRNVCCTEFARANLGRGGRGDARTDAFNFRVIDERSTPLKRAENHGLEICRDPQIRGWWILFLTFLQDFVLPREKRRKILRKIVLISTTRDENQFRRGWKFGKKHLWITSG